MFATAFLTPLALKPDFLALCGFHIESSIYRIVNESLLSRYVPLQFKEATVTPLMKNKQKQLALI